MRLHLSSPTRGLVSLVIRLCHRQLNTETEGRFLALPSFSWNLLHRPHSVKNHIQRGPKMSQSRVIGKTLRIDICIWLLIIPAQWSKQVATIICGVSLASTAIPTAADTKNSAPSFSGNGMQWLHL